MKKLLGILFIATILLGAGVASVAVAQEAPPPEFELPTTGIPVTGSTLLDRIALIGNWVFAIFLALSLIYIILGAFQFVTAAGDPAKITEARQKLIFAVVGIAIALLAAGFDDILRHILVA